MKYLFQFHSNDLIRQCMTGDGFATPELSHLRSPNAAPLPMAATMAVATTGPMLVSCARVAMAVITANQSLSARRELDIPAVV
jgi:hypothetical protein